MIRCPNCGKQNQPFNQFCDDCGAELPKQTSAGAQRKQTGQQMILCPNCRAASPMGSKICTRCQMPFPLSISAVLNNRYQIDTFLSRGGMGAIYKAIDTKAGNTPVALKECSPQDQNPANQPKYIEMFKREARMLEQLKMLSVVPQFVEYFEEQGKPYFTMEFITGTDLLKLMETQNKPFPVDKVVNWSIQLCDVFSFLHRQNPPIVFRDLKPENIMLTKGVGGERIVLVDFGIAREMDVTGHTMTKGIGTQAYMSEEMLQGRAEIRSDLFTLAATMFHLLTANWPESTATPRLRSALPGMPQWLDDIIAINLSRLPADRYNSASELKIDLQKRSVSTTRTCSRCQSVNQIREPYCQKCGTQLSDDSRSCPNCRQSIPRNAKFCIHCGHKLAA